MQPKTNKMTEETLLKLREKFPKARKISVSYLKTKQGEYKTKIVFFLNKRQVVVTKASKGLRHALSKSQEAIEKRLSRLMISSRRRPARALAYIS